MDNQRLWHGGVSGEAVTLGRGDDRVGEVMRLGELDEVDETEHCCGPWRGCIPFDFVTERYRSRYLLASTFFIWFCFFLFQVEVMGTGAPCIYTHVIDPDVLEYPVGPTFTCDFWNTSLPYNDFNQYNGMPTDYSVARDINVLLQLIKGVFAIMGNSEFHSAAWLLVPLVYDAFEVVGTFGIVSHFCHFRCFDPAGDPFAPNPQYPQQECALKSCTQLVHSIPVVEDVFISWGVYLVTWLEAVAIVYVMGWAFLNSFPARGRAVLEWGGAVKASVRHWFSLNGEGRMPGRFFAAVGGNLFVGTTATLAVLYGFSSEVLVFENAFFNCDEDRCQTPSDPKLLAARKFLQEAVVTFRIVLWIILPAVWFVFLCVTIYTVYRFRCDARECRNRGVMQRLEISEASMFIGTYVANSLFSMALCWILGGVVLYGLLNNYIRSYLLSKWMLWAALFLPAILNYLFRVFFLEFLFATRKEGIKYPRLYRFFDGLITVFAVASGPLYGLLRIATALAISAALSFRVDRSLMPVSFEMLDPAFVQYTHVVNSHHLAELIRRRAIMSSDDPPQ